MSCLAVDDSRSRDPDHAHAIRAAKATWLIVVSREIPFAQHSPAERRTTATGRSPGLRVNAGVGPPSQDRNPNGMWPDGSPLTVAGAAGVSNPVPIFIPVSGEPVADAQLVELLQCVNAMENHRPAAILFTASSEVRRRG